MKNKDLSPLEFFYDKSFKDYYTLEDFQKALDVLTYFLEKDSELFQTYQANIAVHIIDRFSKVDESNEIIINVETVTGFDGRIKFRHCINQSLLHKCANDGAKNFLESLIFQNKKDEKA